MVNINLVPEVKKEQTRVKQVSVLVTTVAVIVGGVLLAAILLLGSLLGYRSTKISSVNKDITKIQDELKAYKELEDSVVTLERGLAEIKGIIAGGRDWTAFYGDIEKATPSDIQFVSFKVSGSTVSADLVGKDVKSIDRFIKSFSNYKGSNNENLYANVAVDGYTSKDDGSVSFQAKFDVVGVTK
jgi:hypothetical protein